MKIIKTRKDYRENWKLSIPKEHFSHSPLDIVLLIITYAECKQRNQFSNYIQATQELIERHFYRVPFYKRLRVKYLKVI